MIALPVIMLGIVVLLAFLVAMYVIAGYLRKKYEADASLTNV